jgi:hypothetical protein
MRPRSAPCAHAEETLKGARALLLALPFLLPALAQAADESLRVELNAGETVDNRCRLTFLIENKAQSPVESLKLDLAVFNTDGVVQHRMVTEMAPVRPVKTIVRTFSLDGECKQIGSILVNDVTACAPVAPNACLDGLELASRLKGVRFYK